MSSWQRLSLSCSSPAQAANALPAFTRASCLALGGCVTCSRRSLAVSLVQMVPALADRVLGVSGRSRPAQACSVGVQALDEPN